MYTEQLQQHEALLEEAQKTSRQHAQTVSQLEVIDQNRKSAESTADQLKFDLATTKVSISLSLLYYPLLKHSLASSPVSLKVI